MLAASPLRDDSRAVLHRDVPPGPCHSGTVVVVTRATGAAYEGTTVRLEFVVDATGKPPTCGEIRSGLHRRHRRLDAVKQWRFRPAEANGVAVPMKSSYRCASSNKRRPAIAWF